MAICLGEVDTKMLQDADLVFIYYSKSKNRMLRPNQLHKKLLIWYLMMRIMIMDSQQTLDNPCIGYTITGALHIRGVLIWYMRYWHGLPLSALSLKLCCAIIGSAFYQPRLNLFYADSFMITVDWTYEKNLWKNILTHAITYLWPWSINSKQLSYSLCLFEEHL